MADVINYFPNPDLRTTYRTAMVAGNNFRNPTPTVDLTHWSAVSGGSITRTTAAKLFPENTYGCRVVNGVNFHIAENPSYGRCLTVKVRASSAMTITGSATSEYVTSVQAIGWGDFGWGQTTTWVPGASKTFAAGEECLFRIYIDVFGPYGTAGHPANSSSLWNPVVTLTGTGTFDVDGVVEWLGVDDGYSSEDGEDNFYVPDAPLFFCGDTPDANGVTFDWVGTPHNSPSIAWGQVPKYLNADYNYEFGDAFPYVPSSAFSRTLDGENVATLRSAIGFGQSSILFNSGTGGKDVDAGTLDGLGLTVGQSYVFTADIIGPARQAWEGYWDGIWGEGYVYATLFQDPAHYWIRQRTDSVNGIPPHRTRIVLPFVYAAGQFIDIDATTMGWLTGEIYFTNVGIYEVDQILTDDGEASDITGGYVDLMALGVVAGGTYRMAPQWVEPEVDVHVEYKVGAGSWTVLAEGGNSALTAPLQVINIPLEFTVPAGATDVRLRYGAGGTTPYLENLNLTTAIPEPFTGDTPDGGGYSYSWAGTPGDSHSIRSDAASLEAKVFIGGTAVNVTEARIVQDGVLVNITAVRG